MGIGGWYHTVMAGVNLLCGNVPGAAIEAGAALKSYAVGKALEPIMEPVKETLGEWVGETCDPDIVDNIPYL